ncbi:tyrosine-type recombinase/integrase [uncultured Roseibium sp.]|uniref:tyrosine-type recombinase/integrase n=1 Tax=uncultured Roseibium sp. TaxID=1936171 RepID=UPI002597BBA6|nr:tyrosine-type recombinase/integrase [uncultured Roseibium sp.]
MRKEDRHLYLRGARWHYRRRVPKRVKHLDSREIVQFPLNTASLETARVRRDAYEEADDLYWRSLISTGTNQLNAPRQRYDAAKQRAQALGFTYKHMDQLLAEADIGEILDRLEVLEGLKGEPLRMTAEAVLGNVPLPTTSVSEAMDNFMQDVAPLEMKGMSEIQRKNYTKIKLRAVKNFVQIAGDLAMEKITRDDALTYHTWWKDRVTGARGKKPASVSTANRDIGNMRRLYREYFTRLGEESRDNPFRNLSFRERKSDTKTTPPFETDWITSKILAPGALSALNRQAALLLLALIETGCRPSELCNLTSERIHLDGDAPFIFIDYRPDRAVKTDSSVRRIPLIGVALEALRRAPNGFPRYRDKETNFSQLVMKHFRRHGLFPTPAHRVYSLRHSFEKRMLEAGIDYGLRCKLMGHAIDRPEYGDGGSMEFRRQEMKKIELPFSRSIFDTIR